MPGNTQEQTTESDTPAQPTAQELALELSQRRRREEVRDLAEQLFTARYVRVMERHQFDEEVRQAFVAAEVFMLVAEEWK